MKTKTHSQSGFLGSRFLTAFALGSVGVLLAMLSFAAAPASSMSLAATGPAWSIVTSPNNATQNYLSGVTCASASDCWAVGYYTHGDAGSVHQTLIEHWNGAAWSIVTSPNNATSENYLENYLSGVTCASASDCWAVGSYFDYGENTSHMLIEHWNGTTWSIVTSPNASTTESNDLRGVTCTSASDCWAVGSYVTGTSSRHTLVEHWNGTAWSIVTSPNTGGLNFLSLNFLSNVTCSSASDCWAVGYHAGLSVFRRPLPHATLIERWNGTAWSIVTSPNTSTTESYNQLSDVTCTSASDCWAVGSPIEHWNGTAWSIVTSPNTSATQHNLLNNVTCTSASDCWAVGFFFTGGNSVHTLVEHWNGAAWSIVTSPNTGATQDNYLNGVTCTSASDCWAVGDYFDSGDNAYHTLIERYSSIVPSVNLQPAPLSGWAGPIIVNNKPGKNTDARSLKRSDTLYVSWAELLTGTQGTSVTFYSQLYVDDVLVRSWPTMPPLNPDEPVAIRDFSIGHLSPGKHKLTLVVDSFNLISETDETDNSYTKIITVKHKKKRHHH
jgi:CARDB